MYSFIHTYIYMHTHINCKELALMILKAGKPKICSVGRQAQAPRE